MIKNKIIGLVIADIHFGKKDDKKLYEELDLVFFKRIKELKEDLDIVIIAGDLFDRVIKMNEEGSIYVNNFINRLNNYAKEYNFKIRVLKGTKSHDFNQLDNFKHLSNDSFKVIETVQEEEIFENIFFLYLPEEYVLDPEEYYRKYFELEEDVKYDMIFFHGNLDHASYASKIITSERNVKNSVTFKTQQLKDLAYGKVLGGHVHIKDEFYCGSFSRFAFGEEHDKGFYEFSYDPEELTCETKFIKNKFAPTYATINFSDLEGDLKEKMDSIKLLKEEYDNIRIEFSEEDKALYNSSLETIKSFNDESIKIKVERDITKEIDNRFLFILNKEFDRETTIQKFLKIDKNIDLDMEIIKEATSKAD